MIKEIYDVLQSDPRTELLQVLNDNELFNDNIASILTDTLERLRNETGHCKYIITAIPTFQHEIIQSRQLKAVLECAKRIAEKGIFVVQELNSIIGGQYLGGSSKKYFGSIDMQADTVHCCLQIAEKIGLIQANMISKDNTEKATYKFTTVADRRLLLPEWACLVADILSKRAIEFKMQVYDDSIEILSQINGHVIVRYGGDKPADYVMRNYVPIVSLTMSDLSAGDALYEKIKATAGKILKRVFCA